MDGERYKLSTRTRKLPHSVAQECKNKTGASYKAKGSVEHCPDIHRIMPIATVVAATDSGCNFFSSQQAQGELLCPDPRRLSYERPPLWADC